MVEENFVPNCSWLRCVYSTINVYLFILAKFFPGAIRTTCILDLETKPHYWLTVCAQDQAVVPLYSCVEVRKKVVSAFHLLLLCVCVFFRFLFVLYFLPRLSVKHFSGFEKDKTFPISDVLNNVQQCSHYRVSSFPLRHTHNYNI